jgi:hypothetical protein
MCEEQRERPHFVGVDLFIREAYAVLKYLRRAGAMGHLMLGRYRTPRLSASESLTHARKVATSL